MSKTDALTQPFAKGLESFNSHLLRPQVYIAKKSDELLSHYNASDCLSYCHVIWITPTTIIGNTLNIGIAATSLVVSAAVAPIFLATSICASGLEDTSECLLCEATMFYVEAGIVKDSLEKMVRSIAAPLDALLQCSCCEN